MSSDSQAETWPEERRNLGVLVIGSGAREHALCWKLRQCPTVGRLFAWPGNPGIALHAQLITLAAEGQEAFRQLAYWASENAIDLAVVSDEDALCGGAADYFERLDLRCFGPDSSCARLESSKVWGKIMMDEARIPMARGESFADSRHAKRYCQKLPGPWVVKADGPTGGVGVAICHTTSEVEALIDAHLRGRVHGDASRLIVIEQCLRGEEISVHAVTDGQAFEFLPTAQAAKRLLDGDRGPNTGGMGAYAPTPFATRNVLARIREEIFEPLLSKLRSRMMIYRGILGADVMLTPDGPKALAFNCGLGDPEAQAILPLIEGDLAQLFLSAAEERLSDRHLRFAQRSAACVVLASEGYPEYDLGPREVHGVDPGMSRSQGRTIFHGETMVDGNRLVSRGGRVLSLSGVGDTLRQALDAAYSLRRGVDFEGAQYRSDIGERALRLDSAHTL